MKGGSRRKRLLFALLGLALLGGAAGTGLYLKRASSTAVAAPGSPAAQDGVVLASTAGSAPAADPNQAGASKDEKDKKTAIPVNVSAVRVGAVSSYISTTANLVSENEVKVLAEAEGRVADLLVEEGDQVARGQVLAGLVRDDAEIAHRKAQLKASNARLAFERGEKALAEDLMSRQDFDKLTMENSIADQELAEAKWRLEKTTIRSPFSGRVVGRDIRLGQHIRPGDQLFTVADFDPLIARIYLPERDVFELKEGRDVRITMKASEATQFRGRIRQISPVVDTATGTVKVTVEASSPPSQVRPGAFVTIDIVRETHPRALLVPRDAVVRELQDAYVFVAKGEVAERRTVSLGLEEGGQIEALTGLSAGDQVIVAGQGGLKDGSPIKVLPTSEASDLSITTQRRISG